MNELRRTTLLTVALMAFLVGLVLGRGYEPLYFLWVVIGLFTLPVLFLPKVKFASLIIVVMGGLILGMSRGAVVASKTASYQNLYGNEVVLRATSLEDAVYDERGQLSYDIDHIEIISPISQKLPGRLAVGSIGIPAVYRGDKLEISGKLYPAGGSRQGRLRFASTVRMGSFSSPVETFRREFTAGTQTALPEPQASFGLGLLVGQRNTLPDDVSKTLSIVGLTHIIAVSGYNLTIIVRGVRRLLSKRGSRYQSLILSLVLVGMFLLITGFSASIVRASVVSVLSLMAWYYGRTFKPLLIIALAATITAGVNPIYIWSDIGWYLSFLAFFGVIVIAPLLSKRLFGEKKLNFIAQAAVESVCAQVMAVPLIIFIFSEVSLISIAANVLVVPVIPYAMAATTLAGLAGMTLPAISGVIAVTARFLLSYMLDVASAFSKIPNALVDMTLNAAGVVGTYVAVILSVLVLRRQVNRKYGKITDTNIIE